MHVGWSVTEPLRVAVLDDHSLIQMAMEMRLSREEDFAVVGMYANSKDMLAELPDAQVDLLVLDYVLGESDLDGLHLLTLIRRRFPELRILVSTAAEKPSLVNLVLSTGANGFFGKSEDVELLIDAIRLVAAGETYVSPSLKHARKRSQDSLPPVCDERLMNQQWLLDDRALSPKEREVLRCFLEGMSVSQISRKFTRSIKTISAQKLSAYRKLGVRSDAELFKLKSRLADA